MNIIALYKTWDGGEFVDASLASIYHHVKYIVMVHSDVSWLGERGNTVRHRAIEWCSEFDVEGKVIHIDVSLSSQEAQYQAGLEYISRHKLSWDVIMVVDADEVWEDQYIENAVKQISNSPFPGYRSNMHTYLKTPFFRVDPPYGSPTVFLREPNYLTTSPRGHKAPARHLADVWMHHYTYVRETRDLVERKLYQSALADKSNEEVTVGWMESVYDRILECQNLHAFKRHAHLWKRIQKIWISDLPPAMLKAKLLTLWMPDQRQIFNGKVTHWVSLLDGERNALHRLALGRNQAVDLGTYRGVSAVTLVLACNSVHTVDFYGDALKDPTSEYFTIGGHSLATTQAICDRYGNMTCEASDTVEAGRRWNRGPVDVLFVDAEHTEPGTLANVESWYPHLRQGSRIIFHDDIQSLPGVQAAINRLRQDSRFQFIGCGEYSGSLAACEVL